MSVLLATRRRLVPQRYRRLLLGLLFASPWIIGFLVWTVYPMLSSMYYSLTRYDLLRPPVFLGLGNYQQIFARDPHFPIVMYNTLYYVGIGAPLGVASAFLLACLLNTRIVGRPVWRAIFFIPSIVPATVVAVVWGFLLSPQYGAINATLQAMQLPTIRFLSSPQLIKPSLILVNTWAEGAAIVIFLATLQDVPQHLYEAATVDGANAWHKFWHVTIPMCTPVILFNLVMGFIGGFQTFTMPWLLTDGQYTQGAELYGMYLYRNAFKFLQMGRASALAWVLFAIIVFFTAVLFKSSGRWVYYGAA